MSGQCLHRWIVSRLEKENHASCSNCCPDCLVLQGNLVEAEQTASHTNRLETKMTLMKDAPLPTFGKTITEIMRESLKAVAECFSLDSPKLDQRVVKFFVPSGDRIVGVRVVGMAFEGLFFVSADSKLLRRLRTEVSGETVLRSEMDKLFRKSFDLFQGRFIESGCNLSCIDDTETLGQTNCTPEEWLVSRMTTELGSCWLSFGYSGKLPFASDEDKNGAIEAKDMTFF